MPATKASKMTRAKTIQVIDLELHLAECLPLPWIKGLIC